MNDQITLDHPSCHPVTGWFRATGEWTPENNPDVTIYLTATGRGNGGWIDWDFELDGVELYEGEKHMATAYNHLRLDLVQGTDWSSGEPESLSQTATSWLLGIAYCWAMKSAGDWANKNAEPIAE